MSAAHTVAGPAGSRASVRLLSLLLALGIAGVRCWATVAVACPGDCNGDGMVTVDEVLRGVNIALGLQPSSACPSFDLNGDTVVTINEVITAINAVLNGCPSPA